MGFFDGIIGAVSDIGKAITPGLGSAIGGIASLGGGIMANQQNRDINSQNNSFNQQQQGYQNDWQANQNQQAQTFSAQQARDQMDFQQSALNQQQQFANDQSSTQWQRGVADMKKAGLNPMLAYSQGGNTAASIGTASGASGQGFAGSSHGASSSGNAHMSNAFSTAAATAAEIANTMKDQQVKEQQIIESISREGVNDEDRKYISAKTQTETMEYLIKKGVPAQQAADIALKMAQAAESHKGAALKGEQARETTARAINEENRIPGGENEAAAERIGGTTGKVVSKSVSTAKDIADIVKPKIQIKQQPRYPSYR